METPIGSAQASHDSTQSLHESENEINLTSLFASPKAISQNDVVVEVDSLLAKLNENREKIEEFVHELRGEMERQQSKHVISVEQKQRQIESLNSNMQTLNALRHNDRQSMDQEIRALKNQFIALHVYMLNLIQRQKSFVDDMKLFVSKSGETFNQPADDQNDSQEENVAVIVSDSENEEEITLTEADTKDDGEAEVEMKAANGSVESLTQENADEETQQNVETDAENATEKVNFPPQTSVTDPLDTDEMVCEEGNPVADVSDENKENANAVRPSFACPFCDEIFPKKSSLANHIIYDHQKPKKKVVRSEKPKRKRYVSIDDGEDDEYDNEEQRYVVAPKLVPSFGVLRPQGQAKRSTKMRKVVLWSPEKL